MSPPAPSPWAPWAHRRLRVSPNGRFLQHEDGTPFFWLGDTGWLLFTRLDLDEAAVYLDDRRQKGFNVIQVQAVNGAAGPNLYGELPFLEGDFARPNWCGGRQPGDPRGYGYWDHVDRILDLAAERGLYLALVAVWGSAVKRGRLDLEKARAYGHWLGQHFKGRPNVIWLLGGDIRGDVHPEVWRALAEAIKEEDPHHLMSFHPFGRTQSSTWFHGESWLDFNMFQSGHCRYDQVRPGEEATWKGEDNWRYVEEDYARHPPKPTLDGEPSYEAIPQGLHDPREPYWTADDCRRYAYWAVLAGACGHTYGHNAVMQMHKPGLTPGGYGVRQSWREALDAPGACQMQHLKRLILSRPFYERVPASDLVMDQGERYDRVLACRGQAYLFAYTYTGRPFAVVPAALSGTEVRAWWYDPRQGTARLIGTFANHGQLRFQPPGSPRPGNDWVLVLDDAAAGFGPPGE